MRILVLLLIFFGILSVSCLECLNGTIDRISEGKEIPETFSNIQCFNDSFRCLFVNITYVLDFNSSSGKFLICCSNFTVIAIRQNYCLSTFGYLQGRINLLQTRREMISLVKGIGLENWKLYDVIWMNYTFFVRTIYKNTRLSFARNLRTN